MLKLLTPLALLADGYVSAYVNGGGYPRSPPQLPRHWHAAVSDDGGSSGSTAAWRVLRPHCRGRIVAHANGTNEWGFIETIPNNHISTTST